MPLKYSANCYKKKQKYVPLLVHQLAENKILGFGFYDRTKKGEEETCT